MKKRIILISIISIVLLIPVIVLISVYSGLGKAPGIRRYGLYSTAGDDKITLTFNNVEFYEDKTIMYLTCNNKTKEDIEVSVAADVEIDGVYFGTGIPELIIIVNGEESSYYPANSISTVKLVIPYDLKPDDNYKTDPSLFDPFVSINGFDFYLHER